MTKYLEINPDQKDSLLKAISDIQNSNVIVKINNIQKNGAHKLRVSISNRTNDLNEVDSFLDELTSTLML